MMQDDPRLAEAKAKPIADVVHLLGLQGLKRHGHELVGPCPKCGGNDRFSISLRKGVFQCRRCEGKGDGLGLVMWDRGLDFRAALTWLCGDATGISDAERAERKRRTDENERKRAREADKYRRDVIASARKLWEEGRDPRGTAVEAYLRGRSIDMAGLGGFPAAIRFHPNLPYAHHIGGEWRTVHRGPAMLAAIQGPDGKFSGLHRTWLDLSRPKGKARILHPESGEAMDVKKGLGSKKGGAIRLTGGLQSETMICAEGLETTWSAMMAGVHPGAAFWCLIDMGNMAGRRQSGPGLKYAGLPDLDDAEAFLPPAWVKRLIFVMDGDSDPRTTRAQMEAGLRRAMALRPGLRGQIAPAPAGKDLNDVLMGGGDG